MLQELSIQNFAIIDDLSIQFSDGLTILSGETGAGKSIIINAFNLLLGSRASTKVIRTGAKKAELQALFEIPENTVTAQRMSEAGFDPSEGLLIQRRLLSSERHRIYINGRMATMHMLNGLTDNLASISGQHAHQGLLKENQHLLLLDQFSNLMALRQSIFDAYHAMIPLIDEFEGLLKSKQYQTDQQDLLAFQKREIEEANIQPDEDQQLEKERTRLKNAATLFQAGSFGREVLYDGDGAVVEQLDQVKKALEKAAQIDSDLEASVVAITDTEFQIQEVVDGLRSYCDGIEFDPLRLEAVESRLALLTQLKQKYGGSLAAVLQKAEMVEQQLSIIETVDDQINALQQQLDGAYQNLVDMAAQLSAARELAAKKFCHSVEKELHTLKMANARFDISFHRIKADAKANSYLCSNGDLITETGMDRVAFMIAPNPGETIKALSQIASGGELSRVVLALKAILARTDSVETVVFDEVDAGIGGQVAEVAGGKLKELAAHHQVICITHLPQIAKFGDHHFKIEKTIDRGRTRTLIMPWDDSERVAEIARMLGGAKITQTTLDHALELLDS